MVVHDEALTLLQHLAHMGSFGRAEGESSATFPKTFHPVSEHARAFDPDVVLVVGPRGAGKSELFRAVIELNLLPAILRNTQGVRLPSVEPQRTKWVAGYPVGANFPDARGFSRFLKLRPQPSDGVELWFAYLVRALQAELDEKGRKVLGELNRQPGGDPFATHDAFLSAGEEPLLALDRLNARLDHEDRQIFVGYDELDTLGDAVWETVNQAVKGLVGFWASYTRRWRRVRAKIFLRTDLYQRVGAAGGADLAKLAANRAEIAWSDRNLYAMLIKRIANSDEGLYDYCSRSEIDFRKDNDLGYVPIISEAQDAKLFIERLAGLYMGAGVKKGLTYRWLLEHIRDGRGNALPRPLVRLVEAAGELQANSSRRPRWPHLLNPMSLRRALDKVSEEHVKQSLNEWPWLEGLALRLKGEQVPWDARQIERLLEKIWDKPWGSSPKVSPPVPNVRDFVDYLVEVGIFRRRSDSRIDVPDLFLAGLGLKRKGGVRRR